MRFLLRLHTLLPLVAGPLAHADWRHDLLREEGIDTSTRELRAAASRLVPGRADFSEAYRQLGDEAYPVRQRAQARLLAGGDAALKWLRQQPMPEDPEVRLRVAEIVDSLEFPSVGSRERMIAHAVESLLRARESGKESTPSGVYYEWFARPNDKLPVGRNYRTLLFEADKGMRGRVADGQLWLPGRRAGDGDQCLFLRAVAWPGTKVFPGHFRVSAKLRGTKGGEGAWHLGISVGKVRTLYHPGLAGGGFRFEETGTHEQLTVNEDMGFTPSDSDFQRMILEVKTLADGRVRLDARVDQGKEERFIRKLIVYPDVIGPLSRISLDRSGRTGGDACFDDFTVEILEP